MRKKWNEILIEIHELLEKEPDLSITQIGHKLKSHWATIDKALCVLKRLGVVREKKSESNRVIGCFGWQSEMVEHLPRCLWTFDRKPARKRH